MGLAVDAGLSAVLCVCLEKVLCATMFRLTRSGRECPIGLIVQIRLSRILKGSESDSVERDFDRRCRDRAPWGSPS